MEDNDVDELCGYVLHGGLSLIPPLCPGMPVCSFQCTAEQLEVSDFPSLVVFDGEDRVVYDGKMKPMEIRNFLNQYASGPSSAGSVRLACNTQKHIKRRSES